MKMPLSKANPLNLVYKLRFSIWSIMRLKNVNKWLVGACIFCITGCYVNSTSSTPKAEESNKIWVFFDLGNTIVDTADFTKQHYINGAKDYLKNLRAAGFSIGLTLNIPEEWGTTVVGKFAEIVRFIDGRRKDTPPHAQWADGIEFDWNDFDENGVLFPLKNDERKPKPVLFLRALQVAGACGAVFQGEDAAEIATAESLGMANYHVGQAGRDFYMPIGEIKKAVRAKITTANANNCKAFNN